jgi:hydrogenase maturation protease
MNNLNKILIAGVGNDLKQDDAFGVLLARHLAVKLTQWINIKVLEVGIGGIHMVQELYEGYDLLILADAVNYGSHPGTIHLRELTKIGDLDEMSVDERRDFLADTHYTNPLRALMLAKALNILPVQVMIIGCEAKNHDDYGIGISEEVKKAIPKAEELILKWLEDEKLISNYINK